MRTAGCYDVEKTEADEKLKYSKIDVFLSPIEPILKN